jgi:hypothetical protein
MYQIKNIPSGTIVSTYSFIEDAERALADIETDPATHEIVEILDAGE